MGLKFLLDSVILIDHFNQVRAASSYLKDVRGLSAISVVTRAEVLTGFSKPELREVLQLLEWFPTLPINRPVADLAAALRRLHGWKLPDAFQVALARHHRLKLATRNLRDFPPVRFEFVIVAYSV